MLSYGAKYAINTFPGDGTTTVFNLNFAGGYIRREHVKAYSTSPADVNTTQVLSWTGTNTVSITPAVPAGHTLTIYRDTPKDVPVADFIDGAIINETNLDFVAKQSVFVSAELLDRFAIIKANSDTALLNSNLAITLAQATIGGDFTKFGRTDLSQTWAATQRFTAQTQHDAGVVLGTTAAGRTEYGIDGKVRYAAAAGSFGAWATPWTDLNFNPANYTTTTALNAAITGANQYAVGQAAAYAGQLQRAVAQALAAEQARAQNMEGFLFCWANR